ncbi:MAG: hypothetical protein RLY56_1077 [Pseudomonadota bacterium]
MSVLTLIDTALRENLRRLLSPYGLRLEWVDETAAIPGSYWGESEAGLIGDRLYLRHDTPLHSALHEAAHFVCMTSERRAMLERDAGGDHPEENAVCYLQIVWGDMLPDVGRERVLADMDAWGYTFRLGSAARWFYEDASDAREWLQREAIVSDDGSLTGRCRR